MFPLFFHYDTYERHKVVSTLFRNLYINNMLDVGGRSGILRKFVQAEIITLNIDLSSDIQADGTVMPFIDNCFSAVITLDTIEHIPKDIRISFLKECLRVTNCFLLVAAPFGSNKHKEYEKKLNKLYINLTGKVHQYLDEHIKNGIPSKKEINKWIRELELSKSQVYFAGDYIWQCKNFEKIVLNKKQKGCFSYIKLLYAYLSSIALFHPIIKLKKIHYNSANRFYLFIEKNDSIRARRDAQKKSKVRCSRPRIKNNTLI